MTHGSTCVQFNKYTFIANQLEKEKQTERREKKNEILNAELLCDMCIFSIHLTSCSLENCQ